MKLTQKHLFKGIREFELIDDHVNIRCKAPFKDEETLTVMLTVLNPEPVITSSSLDFTSRVNGETLLSLYLGKPNACEFNTFVSTLKQKALDEYQAFAGLKATNPVTAPGGNVFEEPPTFDDPHMDLPSKMNRDINITRLDEAIQMLKQYLNSEEITDFVAVLEALKAEPRNEALQMKVQNAFNELGPSQGAVLTYAPYVGILMSADRVGSPY
ncbi:hypothetical protein [Sedimenticola sp.]|uniref:hypothetical protein n=1 Tax=Sedimenticola sp. TaxID=1940285 RepID=UPI003D0F0242